MKCLLKKYLKNYLKLKLKKYTKIQIAIKHN